MSKLSDRLAQIKPSTTLAVTQKAQELRSKGLDVISFSAGEPDFDTPAHIVDAAVKAMKEGMTRYTPVPGIPALRKAVAEQSEKVRAVPCDPSRVIVTVGAKHALFGFFQAVLNPGDEVIVPAPYWVSYPDQVLLAGGVPVIVPTSAKGGWMLGPDELEAAITPKTKALVLNTPSNPTGGLYSREAVEALTSKALERDLWIIADEIYRDLIYGDAGHFSPLTAAGQAGGDRIFVVDGVSKTFAMTGWRIGWGIGDPQVVTAMSKIQGQATSNPASMAQAAALAAIQGPMDFLDDWRGQYEARRDVMVKGLTGMDGVTCPVPGGAFYVLPDVSEILGRMGGVSDVELATKLLEDAQIATVPGSAFGAPGHLRLSYATSMEAIEEGLARMGRALKAL